MALHHCVKAQQEIENVLLRQSSPPTPKFNRLSRPSESRNVRVTGNGVDVVLRFWSDKERERNRARRLCVFFMHIYVRVPATEVLARVVCEICHLANPSLQVYRWFLYARARSLGRAGEDPPPQTVTKVLSWAHCTLPDLIVFPSGPPGPNAHRRETSNTVTPKSNSGTMT